MTFDEWTEKWNIPAAALADLRTIYVPPPVDVKGSSEAATQAQLRVMAPRFGALLLRNNNGACVDDTGRMIRYGLGNDSKKVNDKFKSSDLIGVTPVTIRPEHVGRKLGLFTAVEVKHPHWRRPENDRDRAQEAFLIAVNQRGGLGMFVTHEGQYHEYLTRL